MMNSKITIDMQLTIFFRPFHILFLLGLTICLFLFSACESPSTYEENIGLNQEGWFYNDTISFKANIEETDPKYNVFVNVRHSNEYPNSNLWIKILTTLPDGTKQLSPVNIPMADASGKWYGQGFGSVLSNEIQIQQNAVFSQKGTYEFQLIQDMRINPVKELIDVGLKIDQVEVVE